MSTESSSSGTWQSVRSKVLERDGHECKFCGVSDEEHTEEHGSGLEAHHVIPRADGGGDYIENLVTLCKPCHRKFETIHAKAIKSMVRKQDCSAELKEVDKKLDNAGQLIIGCQKTLKAYIKRSPTFAHNFGFYEHLTEDGGEKPTIDIVPSLSGALDPDQPIGSELEFMIRYGYAIGLETVWGGIVNTDIQEYAPNSSGESAD